MMAETVGASGDKPNDPGFLDPAQQLRSNGGARSDNNPSVEIIEIAGGGCSQNELIDSDQSSL
jgi:hypothetical protein